MGGRPGRVRTGVEGLCHISELAEGFVDKVSDVVSLDDEVDVVVINVDD